jgi:DNA-binding transcriptional LysR family regulator
LDSHVQLVNTDPSLITAGLETGVLSSRTWRLADIGAKKSMLLAGLGWGNMPLHLVEDELTSGTLKRIAPVGFHPPTARVVMGAAYISEHSLGPAECRARGPITLVEQIIKDVERTHAGETSHGSVNST